MSYLKIDGKTEFGMKPIQKNTNVKTDNTDLSEVIFNQKSAATSKDYVTNTENNLFLKEYIEGRAASEGVEIPKGLKIKISNYNGEEYRNILSGSVTTGTLGIMSEKYWEDFLNNFKPGAKDKSVEEYCKEKGLTEEQTKKVIELYNFHDVRVNVFKARIKDMFTLLSKSKTEVEKRVAQMQISEEEKGKIISVKDFLDRYYKVEAEYNGKTYNLLNLSEEDKKELGEKAPEFLKFAEKIQPELHKHSAYFAQKEM